MTTWKSWIAVLAGGVALAACNSSAPTSTASEDSKGPEARPIKVALLTPGKVNDSGWNALAYAGLEAVQKELGAEIANQEGVSGAGAKDAMRSYAQKGFNLVIGHGFEYNDLAIAIGPDFPNTVFVSSSGGKTAANVGAFRFYLEEGMYLCGMLAARMTKTGVIGSVAVADYPSIVSTIKAYEAGARAVKPNIKIVPTVYFGHEGDIAAAKQATLTVIDQHADFVIHQANDAAQGVFDACKEKGIHALGTNANQNENASGVVAASGFIIAGPAFIDLAKSVRDGAFKGAIINFNMAKGAIDFAVNPTYAETVPKVVRDELEATAKQIRDGELKVPADAF